MRIRREENVFFPCLHSPCTQLVCSHVLLQPVSHLGEGKGRGEVVESLFIIVVLCATWPRRHRRRRRKLGNRLRWVRCRHTGDAFFSLLSSALFPLVTRHDPCLCVGGWLERLWRVG